MMRFFLLPVLALMSTLAASADAPQNLVTNADFEQVKDGAPAGWTSTAARPGLNSITFPTEKGRGTIARVELLQSGVSGAYVGQAVKVKPHTRYRLSLLARLNKGKITFAVTGVDGPKDLSVRLIGEPSTRMPMAPLFWDANWYKNLSFVAGEWRPVALEFDSGKLSQVYISFGGYFTTGSYAFDDVSVIELGPTAAKQ